MKLKHDKILKIYSEKLKYFNYSENTVKIYVHYLEEFLNFTRKNYQHLTGNDFQFYLDSYNFSSVSQQNQIISSIKFLYEKVLNKKYNKVNFKRPRKEHKQPKIIDYNFVSEKISKIKNLKHKTILAIPFTTGIRVSELINLKLTDIDSNRMIINIFKGKGKKDRIVPMSDELLNLLRKYFKEFRPKEHLFNGQFSNKYTASSCNKLIKRHISNNISMHTLRHVYLTFLADHNTALKTIQDIAGHKNPKTTEIYIHLSINTLKKLPTPQLN